MGKNCSPRKAVRTNRESDETWELFPSGSAETLKALIAKAVTRTEPFIGYYWGLTDVIAKYRLVRLGMPAFDAGKFKCLTDTACAAPEVTGWAVGEVAVVTSLKERAPPFDAPQDQGGRLP